MKTKFNTLHKYIFHISDREYAKETINSLFSSVLAPILSFQETQGCILLKLQNPDENKSLLTRLKFSQCKIYAFCDELKNFGIENIQIENIWKSTQFVVILTQRYSSALIWDYSISEKPDYAKACLLFNSKIISEITRVILDNSSFDYKQIASMYSAERRENRLLNIATENIADVLNNKNEEIIFNAVEKKIMENFDDKIEVAQIVADKAKFISHEIKNCLSVINLYSTILEKRLSKISLDNDTLDSVNNSLKNIKLSDYFPDVIINNFNYTADGNPSKGEYSKEKDSSFDWTIDELKPGELATFRYKLKIKDMNNQELLDKIIDTNEKVTLAYEDDEEKSYTDEITTSPSVRLKEIVPESPSPSPSSSPSSQPKNESSSTTQPKGSQDNTVSKEPLPKTGVSAIVCAFIFSFSIISLFVYARTKKFDDFK